MQSNVIYKSLDQQISLFTLLVYFYAGHKEGAKFHSWQYEVGRQSRKLTHRYAYFSLVRLVEETYKGKFAKAIIYENLTDKQIYTNTKGIVAHPVGVNFRYDENKNCFLDNIDYYDYLHSRRDILQFPEDVVRDHAVTNWKLRGKLLDRNLRKEVAA